MLTSTICLILVFVTSSTLQQVQKTKSFIFWLATVGFRTWVILLTQLTQTCLPAKQKHVQWERYKLHYQNNNIRHFSLQKTKLQTLAFRAGKKYGERRILSILGRQLAKGRLRSHKREIQQCNGDLWQRAKQPQDHSSQCTKIY